MKKLMLMFALAGTAFLPQIAKGNIVITQTGTIPSIGSTGYFDPINLTFDRIDAAVGFDVAPENIVRITVTAIINQEGGNFGATNQSNVNTYTVTTATWNASAAVTSSDVTIPWGGSVFPPTPNPAYQNSYAATVPFNIAPSGTWSQDLPSGSSGVLGGDVASGFYSQYAGDGTFTISFYGVQSYNIAGAGSVQQLFTTSTFSGYIVVEYEVVPEPSTVTMLGLGALGAVLMFRRRSTRSLA